MLPWLIAALATIGCVAFGVAAFWMRPRDTSDAKILTETIDRMPWPVAVFEGGRVFAMNRVLSAIVGPDAELFDADMISDRDVSITVTSGETRLFHKPAARRIEIDGRKLDLVALRDVTEERAGAQNTDVRDRLAAVGTLVASSMHELNSPLTSMTLNLEDALDFARSRSPELVEIIGELQADALRIRELASDLGKLSAPQADALAPTNLVECAELAVRLTAPSFKAKAELFAALDGVPLVMANDSRVLQILINLITNALHAVQDLPGRPRVFVRTKAVDGVAMLEVADEGPGIAEEILDRIFEPMFTTKAYGSGTGLGLYVVKDLAAKLGAEVDVTSEVGAGTTFRVRFEEGVPRSRSGTVSLAATGSTPGDAKILVVDDKVSVLNAVCRDLSRYEVTVARGGEEAIDLLARKHFDLALVDLMMPAVDGRAVYLTVAERDPDQAQRIRFMTGLTCDEDLMAWATQEGLTVLRKPFDAAATVSALLRGYLDDSVPEGPISEL